MPEPSRRTTALEVSFEVAREHLAWARRNGQSPQTILRGIGERVPSAVTWDDVIKGLARQWREIHLLELVNG
jgi:hypothetical protein